MEVASQVRQIYEKRPYPTTRLKQTPWRLAPMEWINAVGRPEWPPPRRILVAGCGTGVEAFALARRFPEASILGVDFSSRPLAHARIFQKRRREFRRVRFARHDLASADFGKRFAGSFDFISCHGVLSYIPRRQRALRNLARCLAPDGALYLGVNGVDHRSVRLRKLLPVFGFDVRELPDDPHLLRFLKLFDAMNGDNVARGGPAYLASDVFGPLIDNFPLTEWVRLARDAGLHFQDSYTLRHALRRAVEHDNWTLLLPRSRGEVCHLAETLSPCAFHRLVFTRAPIRQPPWMQPKTLMRWRPMWAGVFQRRLPRRSGRWRNTRNVTLKSRPMNTLIDWRMPEWEIEILRQADGRRNLSDILAEIPAAPSYNLLRDQLYRLYHLMVINLLP